MVSMASRIFSTVFFFLISFSSFHCIAEEGLPLYYWQQNAFVNFGDYLSLKLVERVVDQSVQVYRRDTKNPRKKLLAIGSILFFAEEGDIIWGTGTNGKINDRKDYLFNHLDVRAVRGPLTRDFLQKTFQIKVPEVYGDPALLMPYFFPEFKKNPYPTQNYIVIPHYSEKHLFPRDNEGHVVYPTDPWDEVIKKILNSQFVISSSLHGIIVAEAYGIPARWLRVSDGEPVLKYHDYYLGTGRKNFKYATSVKEALKMGGEQPFICNLQKLYQSFPFEFWPHVQFKKQLPVEK
jgi:pyruvyltransferase